MIFNFPVILIGVIFVIHLLDHAADAVAGPLPSEELVSRILETIRSPDFVQTIAEDGTIVLSKFRLFLCMLRFVISLSFISPISKFV